MSREAVSPRVRRHTGSCNSYSIVSGDRALLIDCGDPELLDVLAADGVREIEWILHTHHHRDQCRGDERIVAAGARVAAPASEAHLLASAQDTWQRFQLYDRYDCTNVFNTPVRDIAVERPLADYETFQWEDVELTVLPTPGHTKGSVTYLARVDGISYAFCGDLIHASGRVWTLYDLHWDYSNPDAINAALHSVATLRRHRPDALAPSHGEPIVAEPDAALAALDGNLRRLFAVAGRRFIGDVDVPIAADTRFGPVTDKLVGITQTSAHFYALLGDDGQALLFDYGFPSFDHVAGAGTRFVQHSLHDLADRFGVTGIPVVVPTHYHDDHVCGLGWLREHYGTEVWASERFAEILEHPSRFRLPAVWREPLEVDLRYPEGATLEWGGYTFETQHCPGHTWYAVALFGEVDGRRIGITGDEIQLDGQGRLRGGGPVYRNGLRADSFTTSVRKILDREPEILLTGHDGPLEVTPADLDDLLAWCRELEGCFRSLAAFPDAVDRSLDADFVRFSPYQLHGKRTAPHRLEVDVRNHLPEPADAVLRPVVPSGWSVEPETAELRLPAHGSRAVTLTVTPSGDAALDHRHLVTLDLVLAGEAYGEVGEAVLTFEG